MMQDFIGGTIATVVIPLMKGDYPVVPTTGTTTYTVMDHAGLPVAGHVGTPVATDAATHTLIIQVPAEANTIADGKRFERRTVVVNLTSNGHPHRFIAQYRLVPFLNHAVSPQGVRDFLGVNESELPDSAIDLAAAYFRVEADFAPTSLSELLATGTVVEMSANEAIRMKAVLDVLPSMRQRVSQMEANGIHQFRRVEIRDFDKIEREAWERYSEARTAATNPTAETLTMVLVTTDADPLTGE